MLDAILTPRALTILGAVGLALFAFSFAWAFFKVSYQKAIGRPVPRFWLTNALDVAAEIGANLPGAINRALKLAGKPGIFLPTQPADGSAPTASAATIDTLSAENAALREALADYQRRVSDSHAVTAPGIAHPAQLFAPAFDPTARQPIPRDGERGAVDVRALLAVVAALSVVLPLGVALSGCPLAREAALRATPSVPDPADCRPGVMRCLSTPDGMIPVVCSHVEALGGGHREWPALPRDPADGSQRVCLHGCVVDSDSGVAHCVGLAADGGL